MPDSNRPSDTLIQLRLRPLTDFALSSASIGVGTLASRVTHSTLVPLMDFGIKEVAFLAGTTLNPAGSGAIVLNLFAFAMGVHYSYQAGLQRLSSSACRVEHVHRPRWDV